MTNAQIDNALRYALMALLGALVTTGLQLAEMLSGTDDIIVRPLLATFTTAFFGALATALGASQLSRLGSEGLARQVNELRASGVSRSEMVVLSQEEAAAALAVDPDLLTEAQTRQVADELERRMKVRPAREDAP